MLPVLGNIPPIENSRNDRGYHWHSKAFQIKIKSYSLWKFKIKFEVLWKDHENSNKLKKEKKLIDNCKLFNKKYLWRNKTYIFPMKNKIFLINQMMQL